MTRLKQWTAALALLAATAGATAAAPAPAGMDPAAATVRTVLFPQRHAVLSAEVESPVVKIGFRDGESFPAGALLVEFDARVIRQQLRRARSSEREAAAQLAFARKNREVAAELQGKGMQGRQELERAELEVEIAAARLESAQAALQLAEKALEDCQLKAPFAGKVIRRLVQEHELVRPGTQVIQIIDDRTLLAALHLESTRRNQVAVGAVRNIRIDETGEVYSGKVVEISGEVDAGSRTFEIRLQIDNAGGRLAAGMSGELLPEARP